LQLQEVPVLTFYILLGIFILCFLLVLVIFIFFIRVPDPRYDRLAEIAVIVLLFVGGFCLLLAVNQVFLLEQFQYEHNTRLDDPIFPREAKPTNTTLQQNRSR
jgi:hypothetical protein